MFEKYSELGRNYEEKPRGGRERDRKKHIPSWGIASYFYKQLLLKVLVLCCVILFEVYK